MTTVMAEAMEHNEATEKRRQNGEEFKTNDVFSVFYSVASLLVVNPWPPLSPRPGAA